MKNIYSLRSLIMLITAICIAGVSNAQLASTYNFTSLTGTYSSISGTGTYVGAVCADDANQAAIPIGFPFVFSGITYNTVSACSNGWLSLSGALPSAAVGRGNSTANATTIGAGFLMAYWDDLDGGSFSSPAGTAYYLTTGVSPNRVFTFEWKEFTPFFVTTRANFQIKLYESSNVVEYWYGTGNFASTTATIGISNSGSDYQTLSAPSAAPTSSSTAFTTTIATSPANGQIYRWYSCAVTASASNSGPVCPGGTVTLTGVTTGTSYSWAGPGSYSSLSLSPVITGATAGTYTLSATNGTCTTTATTTVSFLAAAPVPVITPSVATICNGGNVTLTATVPPTPGTILSQNFNTSIAPWVVDNTGSTTAAALSPFQLQPNGYFYSPYSVTFNSPDNTQFLLSIPDAGGSGSVTSTRITSPVFSLVGYSAATFSFQHNYRRWATGDVNVNAEISTNGGLTWTVINNYFSGGVDVGATGSFATASFPLTAYLGMSNCMVRFNYTSTWGFWWALDNILITGTPTSSTPPTWTPTTHLFSDPGFTTPYVAGTPATNVYVHPTTVLSPIVVNYVATVTGSGCSSMDTTAVTINTPPTSVSATASGTALCVGNTLTLTGTATGATTYSWSGPGGYSSTALSPAGITVSTLSSGIYTLVASSVCGTVTATTASVTVTAGPAGVTATASATTLCSGDILTLTGTAVGGVSYSWSGPGGYSAAVMTPSSFAVTPSSSGIYTFTATNTCGAIVATTASVTVNSIPTGVSATASSTVLCAGNTLTLTGTATSPITTTYFWSGPGGYSAAVLNPAGFAVTTLSAGIYSLTATNACGSNNATTASVTVNTPPTAVTAAISATPLCAGNPLTLTGTATSPIATTYSWSGPGGYSAAVLNPPVITTTTLSAGVYTLTATNTCGSTTANTASLVVNTVPTAVIATANPTTLCSGDALTLTGAATSTIPVTYGWSGPGSYSSAVQNPPAIITTTASAGVYTITATNVCGNTTATTAAVVVNTVPTAVTATPNATVLCSGDVLTLTGTATSPITTTYSWSGPNSYSSAVLSPAGFVTSTLSAGVYTLTATNVCGSTSATTPSIIINTVPSTVTATASATTLCAGNALTLTGTSTSPITTTYLWNGPGGYSSTNLNPAAIITTTLSTGIYTLTATNVCGSVADTTAFVTVNSTPTAVTATAAPTPLCSGSTLTLTGTATSPIATTYSWSGPNAYSSTNLNPAGFVTSTASAGVYTLTATNSCGSTSAVTTSVVVRTVPTGVTATVSPTTLCSGSTLSLTGTSTSPITTTYSWSGPNSYSSAVQNPAPFVTSTLSAGVYTFTATNICGSTTATTASVTVNRTPTGVTASASPTSVCSSATLTLTGTATSPITTTYSWSGPGGYSSAVLNPAGFITSTLSAGVYTLTATNTCGSSIATTTSVIVVGPPTGVTANIVVGSLCSGFPMSLVGGASNATNYSWSGPAGYSSTLLNPPTFTASVTSSGTYTLAAGNSCFTVTATASIVIAPLPPMGPITGITTICEGSTSNLADTVLGGVWSSSNPSVATINAIGTVMGVAMGTTTISYTNTNTCGTALATTTVAVIPVPASTPVTGSSLLCQGSASLYSNIITGGAWSTSNPAVATINGATGLATGMMTGSAIFYYTVNNGCGTPVTDTFAVSVITAPVAGNIFGPIRLCISDTMRLYNYTTGGTWHVVNGRASITSTGGLVTGNASGVDTAYYVVTNSCGTDTTRFPFYIYTPAQCAALGVGAVNVTDFKVSIYPNPNSGSFTLSGSWIEGDNDATIDIIDLLGQVVYRKDILISNGKIDEQVQMGNGLSAGMYMLRINSANAHDAIRFTTSQ
ncbi:hypothetical protein CJD36_011990 [Flavipsychrobacter stenotrophus]|uniref:Secretion system C-terminal sorting domain-containing protein n=1 Tax=Flavipsychrobacter stenotrophus TaxID=2077091 RepID=A0A2S7SVX6_9BACT|nr:T9SS type A sorting domain-containing protein [Flavipsychrobacter stenotrophus]PQJ10686.1 hypothetical protein CJD36_011990 [Flavipsychrobacter stenotrophus]